MHPMISYYQAQARLAGLRRDAQRDTLARSAGRLGRRCHPGRRPRGPRRTRAVPGTARAAHLSWLATHRLAEPARPFA
jgi:hypothetical protein